MIRERRGHPSPRGRATKQRGAGVGPEVLPQRQRGRSPYEGATARTDSFFGGSAEMTTGPLDILTMLGLPEALVNSCRDILEDHAGEIHNAGPTGINGVFGGSEAGAD